MPILVLGARTRHGRPSRVLEDRLRKALPLLDAAPDPVPAPIVVSGHGEARAMADWLVGHGVDKHAILQEPRARSTNENLENARSMLPDTRKWTVVTSDFHVWRTRLWAWHLGIPADVVGARTAWPGIVGAVLRECLALPHSALRIAWRRAQPAATRG